MTQSTTGQDTREQVCTILSEIKGHDVRPVLAEQCRDLVGRLAHS